MLELQQVSKMFTSEKGLKNIDFKVNPGEIHALIGENGAGKTSIIKTILSYYPIDNGKILWENKPILFGNYSYKREIGYIPDDETLLEYLTPNEIIEFIINAYSLNPTQARQNAKRLFRLLDLQETNIIVNQFSRGMRKKVQLVSALIHHPKMLILDEPISGFDPTIISIMKDLLIELKNKGTSVIISTHDLSIANDIFDHVSVVKNGEIVLSSTKQELIKQNESLSYVYSQIYKKEVSLLRSQIHHVVSSL